VASGQGFPPGYEYRWADARTKTPISVSGPQYVQHVISWVEGEIGNEHLFPTSAGMFLFLFWGERYLSCELRLLLFTHLIPNTLCA
jgi:hypothetical protein